jgi:uncharacterized Zn finger protein
MSAKTNFKDLTWEALEDWAGRKVTTRGKSLVKRVSGLCVSPGGGLLASVQGGRLYASRVWKEEERLKSVCSCPYGVSCKHAVAVVLAYLEAVREGIEPPEAKPEDPRLLKLEEDDGPWEDDDEEGESHSATESVQELLSSLSNAERKKLLADLVRELPGVEDWVRERALLKKGDPANLVIAIRKALETSGPYQGWNDRWHEPDMVDFSRVETRLQKLLDAGHADEVVEFGPRILEAGGEEAEASHHNDWDIQMGVADCLKVVFRALDSCSLSPAERILWEIDLYQQDDYGLAEVEREPFLINSREPPADVWSEVADELLGRLDAMVVDEESDYKRKLMIRWTTDALRGSEREEDLTSFLKREAERSDCHGEWVEHLISLGRTSEAAVAARTGIEKTRDRLPEIASHLETILRELAESSDEPGLAAAFRVREFFLTPGTETYEGALAVVEPLGLRNAIRSFLLEWLETGALPHNHPDWPLPSTGLPDPEPRYGRSRFPDVTLLINIAILENRPEDALRWFRSAYPNDAGPDYGPGEKVADVVRDLYPDQALLIWRERAYAQIRHTKPAAYQVAASYLGKIRDLLADTGRVNEWTELLRTIRDTHRRKRRLMEELDRLEGKEHRILS